MLRQVGYLLQSEKSICISTKIQAQCESGSGYQVWLGSKTAMLWLVLQDEVLDAHNMQWQNNFAY